jgi:hypothetical protein
MELRDARGRDWTEQVKLGLTHTCGHMSIRVSGPPEGDSQGREFVGYGYAAVGRISYPSSPCAIIGEPKHTDGPLEACMSRTRKRSGGTVA